ncbi:hypothetical protein [Limnoglobus roseus]|uniref:Uncharacterized protein n=1 Tax=Limnoglobus roseus TaxID=2598579 RepID=A0A5C1ACH5_9BACT|nr:hypothetical protein [Limnoglobus roseus]QEL17001.1 hypothetical protein PX52LOC_03977 [Limnoglobus roseus]
MLAPFFSVAMTAPGRQLTFRRVAVIHVFLVAILTLVTARQPSDEFVSTIAQLLLVLGLVEGAAVIGWRLVQLPKSQALEFLLTSPIQPRRLFLAESLVGITRFALVCLSGFPVLMVLPLAGVVEWPDLFVLLAMPFAWGVVAGLCLTAWIYEPAAVRRIGELLGLFGVLVYLVVGVVAGENLRLWLQQLPDDLGRFLFNAVMFLHTMNPFGVVRYWFAADRRPWLAWERFLDLHLFAVVLFAVVGPRAAFRLRGHFHDRHYKPISSDREAQLELIGDRPLSWWAVRRVMEYSGRVNLWLACGFALVYAAFLVAGDDWPAWMGKLVFMLFESWGGPAMVATALVVLSAVPAVYQFGLWDATVTARCQRLELLLLTDLTARDYAHASFSAAWRRGRGYLVGAAFLWVAMAVSGRAAWWDCLAAAAGAFALWALSFATGYRGFATGNQTNGIASLFTLGLPLALIGLWRVGEHDLASLLPTAATFVPLKTGVTPAWAVGFALTVGLSAWLLRTGLKRCDVDLRKWYDANQGRKSVE